MTSHSNEKLLAADTDNFRDIYQRQGTTTTLVVPANGAFDTDYVGTSTDGTKVFVETAEPLLASDTDSGCTDDVDLRPCRDVYQRSGGTTTLLSIGTINGNGTFDAALAGVSPDGNRVTFQTEEALLSGDTDAVFDVYQRLSGTTTLVSVGAINGNGAFDVFYRSASDDGSHVFFTTAENLTAGDSDGQQDIYDRSAGATSLISGGAINGNGPYMVAFRGNSADGLRVFFTTRERLVSGDSDPVAGTCVTTTCSFDVYERFEGATSLVSFGPDNGNRNATWGGNSAESFPRRRLSVLDNGKLSSYFVSMSRRKPGTLLPLETEILEVALSMLPSGQATFHGFGLARTMREQSGSRALTGHGTLYKALSRLEEFGLLASHWEDPAVVEGRPRRRLYELTKQGAQVAAQAVAGKAGQALDGPHASLRSSHDAGAHGRTGRPVGAVLHAEPPHSHRPTSDRRDGRRSPRPHRP